MAPRKKIAIIALEPKPPVPKSLTYKEQLQWFKDSKPEAVLYVATPPRTSILEIFAMPDDAPLLFDRDGEKFNSTAGVYKAFVAEQNPSLFSNLSSQAASTL